MQALNREYAPTRDSLAKTKKTRSPCADCKTTYVLDEDGQVKYLCNSCLAFSAYQKRLLKEEKSRW